MKAYLKNYRQSPRKVRLVADLIRGKKVEEAQTLLRFTPQRASGAMKKLLDSAIANAEHNFKVGQDDLFVKEIMVDEGIVLRRWRARARGRAGRIMKRTSNVSLSLASEKAIKEMNKEEKASPKKEVVEKEDKNADAKEEKPKAKKATATTKKEAVKKTKTPKTKKESK